MKYFTIVGSRETPNKEYEILRKLSYHLSESGWIGRSGGADGADTAGQDGWWQCTNTYSEIQDMEIYIPWDGFNGRYSFNNGVLVASNFDNWNEAQKIASEIHPIWEKLKQGAKSLHTRNIYQVLGEDLATPSKFLVCYAKPQGDSVQGGTRTAWECAKLYEVPRFNLHNQNDLERIQKYLEK